MKAQEEPGETVSFDTPSATELLADTPLIGLYDATFPKNQREPMEVIARTVQTGRGLVLRARVKGRTVGLSTAHLLEKPPAVFMVYLAVAPEWRKHRIGSALFERTWAEGSDRLHGRDLAPCYFLWEVERPELAKTEEERSLAQKRIAFFQRLGGRHLFPDYQQPPVNGPGAVPMSLMARAVEGQSLPALPSVVRAVYFEKYGGANGVADKVLTGLLNQALKTI